MDIYRRTNGWFDDDDPCLILSWRRTIVIWSPFDPITVPLLARKSITKHVLLRAKNDAWVFNGGPTGDSTITIPVRFCREEEQSHWITFDQSRFFCLLESPSRNMFFFAQEMTHGYLSADQRVIRRWRSLFEFVVKKNNHHLINFRTNNGSSAC